jgi:hypothetical protein
MVAFLASVKLLASRSVMVFCASKHYESDAIVWYYCSHGIHGAIPFLPAF